MIGVAVVGAGGKMGREVCRAVSTEADLDLVALVDPYLGEAPPDLTRSSGEPPRLLGDIESLDSAQVQVQVVVDFTVAEVATRTMRWCAANGVHAVVGTTGISDEVVAELADVFSASRSNCVIAPNFAVGAVLMMRFAELAAPLMDGAEIVELHHDRKLDAPSGTAILSARRMEQARSNSGLAPWPEDRTSSEPVHGARGGSGPGGVRLHSVRLPGLVAHQEILLGAPGQSLTIRHDAYDRSSFMPGVLMSIRAVSRCRGLTVGLDSILGLEQGAP